MKYVKFCNAEIGYYYYYYYYYYYFLWRCGPTRAMASF